MYGSVAWTLLPYPTPPKSHPTLPMEVQEKWQKRSMNVCMGGLENSRVAWTLLPNPTPRHCITLNFPKTCETLVRFSTRRPEGDALGVQLSHCSFYMQWQQFWKNNDTKSALPQRPGLQQKHRPTFSVSKRKRPQPFQSHQARAPAQFPGRRSFQSFRAGWGRNLWALEGLWWATARWRATGTAIRFAGKVFF